ncbi:sodium:proton antiporter [Shewanella sp. CG12_big_fil_rev_8_21_14_0_65_47_15]|uniref:cation:proton antiporter n=1 Tax=Shewanella sp. CG12_big_fil_rev_8_21_14_0_65_47_15 TaxID=1975537 RepID=UPI000CBEC1E2|nr:sodium:proton antiporter [Shewanella sp. CG12_big_fil_rev_8_21_14_0_65_47_15]PIW59424.1 MAG: sodium:proton antiporter [Shewanella sp. CG12_big_fil_rev_8_21_14_0_65_47_15]
MSSYQILCILCALALVTSVISSRVHKLQETVAITALALGMSLLLLLGGKALGGEVYGYFVVGLKKLDFQALLLNGMLGFLLFAGALQIRLSILKHQKWEILILACVSTLLSTFIIGGLLFWVAPQLGLPLALTHCLLFGALISPTDPIAVLAILKKMGAPEDIAIQVEGESLFNDGIGLVVFVVLSQMAFSTESITTLQVSVLFFHEAIGGLIYGAVLGFLLHHFFRYCEEETQLMLVTLLIPTAGYVMAEVFGVSGPLAMVSAGIIIGNFSVPKYFVRQERVKLLTFWSLIESFFNALLFLLLGLLLLLVTFKAPLWWFMFVSIPLVLLARAISVLLPYRGFRLVKSYNPYAESILIWGGLRGGLALAMAMSLPQGIVVDVSSGVELRELLLVMTYAVVVFSILVQGSTMAGLIRRSNAVPVNAK